jgi:2-polyprenyl-3-methyl-5-hydroxy-6-metoxy-1,4-benzoquinol methylase
VFNYYQESIGGGAVLMSFRSSLKGLAKHILPSRVTGWIGGLENNIRTRSILSAVREQKLMSVYHQLTNIVPDITHQYISCELASKYRQTKVRGQHSFQIALTNEALELIDSSPKNTITIVDIGDSAGTHLQYIKGLHQNRKLRCLSVNMDSEAVRRIQETGLEAICARAEDLASLSIEADIFLSFEMLEHLMNPAAFLHSLSEKNCHAFVVTVPYVARSRVGLQYIRHKLKDGANVESTHILELSPQDWRLLFQHSGWAIKADRIYLQYPRKSLFSFWLKRYWRQQDFEGFYGAILKPDKTWSGLYDGWSMLDEAV